MPAPPRSPSGEAVVVRTYDAGLGNAFLLSFPGKTRRHTVLVDQFALAGPQDPRAKGVGPRVGRANFHRPRLRPP